MTYDLAILLGGGFLAAFASGLAGFAFALIASGIWYHVLPPQEAAPLVVVGSLLLQLGTVWALRGVLRWDVLRPFLIGGAVGVPLGTLALAQVNATALAVGIGLLMVGYAIWMLARLALRIRPPQLREGGRRADAVVGFAGGILGGIGGFSGVLPTIWADLRGWQKDAARAVYQPFIVMTQALTVVTLAVGGFFSGRTGELLVYTLPALALGGWLGVRLYRAATAEAFRFVLLALLLVSGLSLIV